MSDNEDICLNKPQDQRGDPVDTFVNPRRVDIRIYFQDSPSPLEVRNVCHIGTEGGLLRVMAQADGQLPESQWWPLCNIFNIRQLAQRSAA